MITQIEIGQVYVHESGAEYEVLDIMDTLVEFKSTEGVFVRMDPDHVFDDIQTGALVLLEDLENGEDGDDE